MVLKAVTSTDATVKKITAIVNQLRTAAKGSGKEEFTKSPLKKIIEDSFSLVKDRFVSQSIKFELICPEEIEIDSRPLDFTQALLCLFKNSLDATQDLSEKWIKIEVKKTEATVEIEFTDNGRGIPAQIQSEIINSFFTTDSTNKKLGLGLTVANHFINQHSGTLELWPSAKNTTFKLRFPQFQDHFTVP